MSENDKPIVWLQGEVKTPPFSQQARIQAGFLLRKLQRGELIDLPLSRPMPNIGHNCHEIRITDKDKIWRIAPRLTSSDISARPMLRELFSTGLTRLIVESISFITWRPAR